MQLTSDILTGLFGSKNNDQVKNIRKLVKAKRYSEALKVGTKYLQKVPENNDVQFIVGSIYYLQGKYRHAIQSFDKALDIGSYDVEVLILKANSHHILGENKHAVKCCKKILEVDSKNKAALKLLHTINL